MLLGIIIATQVPQTPSASKSQTKVVFDVGGFHLAPSTNIILAIHVIHVLHLSKMVSWKMDGWQFEDYVLESDGKKGYLFDFDFIVV